MKGTVVFDNKSNTLPYVTYQRFVGRDPCVDWCGVMPEVPLDLQGLLVPVIQGVEAVQDGVAPGPILGEKKEPSTSFTGAPPLALY